MILIGSRALALRAPMLLRRSPKDFDFVCSKEEFDDWLKNNASKVGVDPSDTDKVYSVGDRKMIVHGNVPCEFEIVNSGTSTELLCDIVKEDKETTQTSFGSVPSLDLLFTLKKSHRFLKDSPHFWKNASDYHALKKCGAKVRPEYQTFLSLREKETYKNKAPKLVGVSKKEFFNPDMGVKYLYDHDSLHLAVKALDRPAYRFFMKDGAEVQCDKEKFFSIPREVQLLSVLEESYVLALERSQIPFPGALLPRQSFLLALSKVATSISSGWWREFAYENIFDVLKLYSDEYLDRFKDGLNSGVVKPFNEAAASNPYK